MGSMGQQLSNFLLEYHWGSDFLGNLGLSLGLPKDFIWAFLKGFCIELIGTCLNCENRKMFDSCHPLEAYPIKGKKKKNIVDPHITWWNWITWKEHWYLQKKIEQRSTRFIGVNWLILGHAGKWAVYGYWKYLFTFIFPFSNLHFFVFQFFLVCFLEKQNKAD